MKELGAEVCAFVMYLGWSLPMALWRLLFVVRASGHKRLMFDDGECGGRNKEVDDNKI